MREQNMKRNKSCGCLKEDNFHKFVFERAKRPALSARGSKFFEPFCDKGLTPAQICIEASKQGLFVPLST